MSHAYAVANALAGLAVGNFTWSTGGVINRGFLNDGRMDKVADSGGTATTTSLVIDMGGPGKRSPKIFFKQARCHGPAQR